jgi:FlaA1/EpsC-like NDP-sugar epimerase
VNVIGTRGSVIETFTQQVVADRALSITDDRMTRYWISMDEALWCALLTARCADPGEVLMPDCGQPVPILETAQRLAGWYRPERVPYPIMRTGIRPGERLHEVLLSPHESVSPISADEARGLNRIRSTRSAAALDGLDETIDRLERLVLSGDRQELARAALEAADALQ